MVASEPRVKAGLFCSMPLIAGPVLSVSGVEFRKFHISFVQVMPFSGARPSKISAIKCILAAFYADRIASSGEARKGFTPVNFRLKSVLGTILARSKDHAIRATLSQIYFLFLLRYRVNTP